MSGRLNGKVALITGASRGVGLADAQLMVAEGAKVVMTDINSEQGEAAAKIIGKDAMFIKQDVSSQEDWAAVIQAIRDTHGRLYILVNNAAILLFG